MKKNYQILLCEDFYDTSTETFIDKRVCEIASSKSSFSGQAYNIEFYTKIDGTHELSFELPRYYLDEETGKKVSNELVELLVNKCKLELLLEGKSFFFIINERKDEHGDGVFSYSYSCTDAYIEELSKNGYGLVFSDEVEGNGLGTIHQLAEEIAKEDTYTPLHYQSEDKWEMYVARGTEGIGRIDVDGFARLEQTVNPEHRAAESNDGLVGGEHREYLVAETSTDN